MYTGRTQKPCCLCGSPETAHRIDVPPRAVQLLKHAGPIAWQDIEGEVSLYFCEDDWETVCELVLETGMSPLSRCNAGRASFVLREDFEALLNATRAEPDQRPLERPRGPRNGTGAGGRLSATGYGYPMETPSVQAVRYSSLNVHSPSSSLTMYSP